jgi:hypothetical protein
MSLVACAECGVVYVAESPYCPDCGCFPLRERLKAAEAEGSYQARVLRQLEGWRSQANGHRLTQGLPPYKEGLVAHLYRDLFGYFPAVDAMPWGERPPGWMRPWIADRLRKYARERADEEARARRALKRGEVSSHPKEKNRVHAQKSEKQGELF